MVELHDEISDLLCGDREDHFLSPLEARKKAMDFLARREYGQTELIRKLADKGFDRAVTEQAVQILTEAGLQSDARFAAAFVHSRIGQGKGPMRIRLDLSQRGVGDSTIKLAIEASASNWMELARAVRLRTFGRGKPPDFKTKAKQMRFLQYRGFEQEHIQAAFNGD